MLLKNRYKQIWPTYTKHTHTHPHTHSNTDALTYSLMCKTGPKASAGHMIKQPATQVCVPVWEKSQPWGSACTALSPYTATQLSLYTAAQLSPYTAAQLSPHTQQHSCWFCGHHTQMCKPYSTAWHVGPPCLHLNLAIYVPTAQHGYTFRLIMSDC